MACGQKANNRGLLVLTGHLPGELRGYQMDTFPSAAWKGVEDRALVA